MSKLAEALFFNENGTLAVDPAKLPPYDDSKLAPADVANILALALAEPLTVTAEFMGTMPKLHDAIDEKHTEITATINRAYKEAETEAKSWKPIARGSALVAVAVHKKGLSAAYFSTATTLLTDMSRSYEVMDETLAPLDEHAPLVPEADGRQLHWRIIGRGAINALLNL